MNRVQDWRIESEIGESRPRSTNRVRDRQIESKIDELRPRVAIVIFAVSANIARQDDKEQFVCLEGYCQLSVCLLSEELRLKDDEKL